MKINSIKKNKGLYEIIFDNDIVKYHEEVIIKYGLLRNNIELSLPDYEKSLIDNRYFLCRDKAIKYLVNIKFINQVREYLLKSEEETIVSMVINNLIDNKVIDDYNTSSIYTLSRYKKGYGNKELKNRLLKHKVDKDIIEKVLFELQEEEIEFLEKYTVKLVDTIKSLNEKDLKKKIEQRLISHGYNFFDIKRVINDNTLLLTSKEHHEDILEKNFEKALRKYIEVENYYTKEQKIINFLLYKGFEIDKIKEKISYWKKGDN